MRPFVGILLIPREATISVCAMHPVKEVCQAYTMESAREYDGRAWGVVVDLADTTPNIAHFIASKMMWLGASPSYAYGASSACAKELKRRIDMPGAVIASGAL